jgi:manganese oxidase
MMSRREMLGAAAVAAGAIASGAAIVNRASSAFADPPLASDRDYTPVHTLNGVTLPFKIVDGVKVMHLVAGEIEH